MFTARSFNNSTFLCVCLMLCTGLSIIIVFLLYYCVKYLQRCVYMWCVHVGQCVWPSFCWAASPILQGRLACRVSPFIPVSLYLFPLCMLLNVLSLLYFKLLPLYRLSLFIHVSLCLCLLCDPIYCISLSPLLSVTVLPTFSWTSFLCHLSCYLSISSVIHCLTLSPLYFSMYLSALQ